MSQSLTTVTKYLRRRNLKEKEFIYFGLQFKKEYIMVVKSEQQEPA